MKKQILFIHIICMQMLFSLVSVASGQMTDSSLFFSQKLRISLSGLHYQVKDELIVPIRWDGVGGSLGFSYLTSTKDMDQEIEFLLPVSFLTNRYDHNAYAWEVFLGYIRLYRIDPSFWGGTLYLGGQIRWNANCEFYADWDDSHLYWLNLYDLSPALKWSKDYDLKNRLSVTIQIPLLALISRPPENQYFDQAHLIKFSYYLEALHSKLRLTSINEYVALSLKVDYTLQVSETTILGGSWLVQYKNCQFPKDVTIISNSLVLNYIIIL